MYQVIRRASNQWSMDDSADNPTRPYGERVILETGESHEHLADAAIECDARNLLLACGDDRWTIESDDPDDAERLDDDLAAVDIEAAEVGDWLERNGEDRTLAD